jgi:hypothetical protein
VLKLRRVAGSLILALALGAGGTLAAGAAAPDDPCEKKDESSGKCSVKTPGDPPKTDPVIDPGTPGGGDKTTPRKCWYSGQKIPCSDPQSGVWLDSAQCYVSRTDPQPPKSDPVWGGHTDGAIYLCFNPWQGAPSPDPVGAGTLIWLPEPPISVDPEELARRAIDSMGLRAIEVGLSVKDLPGRMIYVGAPVWMWTANPSAETLGPNTASASAGGITVTAEARVESIDWSMGDGATVKCVGEHRARGTIYKRAFGVVESPTCGYRYEQPTASTTITATSHWVIDWYGGGASGTVTMDLERSTNRPVGEVQVLVEQDGDGT